MGHEVGVGDGAQPLEAGPEAGFLQPSGEESGGLGALAWRNDS